MLSKRELILSVLLGWIVVFFSFWQLLWQPLWLSSQELRLDNRMMQMQLEEYSAWDATGFSKSKNEYQVDFLPERLKPEQILLDLSELAGNYEVSLLKISLLAKSEAEAEESLRYGSYAITCSGTFPELMGFLSAAETNFERLVWESFSWRGMQGRIEVYGEFRAYFDPAGLVTASYG